MKWYLMVWKKYAEFSGRARRTEYWMFVLFHVLACIVLSIIDFAVGMSSLLLIVYALASIIPSLAVAVRRLHDIRKSGWFYFVSLIPLIGGIWLLVMLCTEGDRGPNEYGSDPKEFGEPAAF